VISRGEKPTEGLLAAQYLAGEAYSLADVAVVLYILRLELLGLSRMWGGRPTVAGGRAPTTEEAIFKRMTEADAAPFRNLQPDPWAKVRVLLNAA
jgi:glutathione S-transferase